jgi:hypothetical protein
MLVEAVVAVMLLQAALVGQVLVEMVAEHHHHL